MLIFIIINKFEKISNSVITYPEQYFLTRRYSIQLSDEQCDLAFRYRVHACSDNLSVFFHEP